MPEGSLLLHLVTALGAAMIGAAVALRFRQPLILGYILAGVVIGPFTPGFIGSTEIIAQLAEIGVIFMMFVIGVQLSPRELLRASRVAILGGLVQVAAMIGIGYLVGRAFGWGHLESFAFGAVISNSSSTVLAKILSDRGEIDSAHARLGLAWSSVQDISTVVIVAVFAFASTTGPSAGPLLGKAAVFFFVVLPLAFFGLPWLLHRFSSLRSREFFALAVVTLALAMAGGASLLGVSLALGAFLTGIVMGESDLAHRILGDATPLRDIFAGTFFVSIGMLLDPRVLVDQWALVLLTVALIVVVKGGLTTLIARWLGSPMRLAVLLGAALAQSAEFSFLMARIGLEQGALTASTFNLLLTATVVTILLSPAANGAAPMLLGAMQRRRPDLAPEPEPQAVAQLQDHAIVGGYGRVGRIVCALLERHGMPFVVVEEDHRNYESLRAQGKAVVLGDVGISAVLDRAHVRTARLLVLCIPERMSVRRALEYARTANPSVHVLARTHSADERAYLEKCGADEAVVGELELALELGRRALVQFGVSANLVEQSVAGLRKSAD